VNLAQNLLYPAAAIRTAKIDGIVVVLDLRTNSYLLLDKTATAMFEVLTTQPDHDVRVAHLAARLGTTASVIEADLRDFTTDCFRRGMLSIHPPPPMRRPDTVTASHATGLALRAWWSLLTTCYRLKWRSLAAAYEACARLPKPILPAEPPAQLVRRAERAFLIAENLFPLRTAPRDCLPRSLALFSFLNSLGIACDHNIGVIRTPFTAHAWVEVGGSPVLEQRHDPQFHRLARI
jgi:hypothetical protein